ncbi:MAG: DAK2 domain-containing protein [Bacillales bacterium]|nr:DAK2 domain-containing protein [Bacillales bacterium]
MNNDYREMRVLDSAHFIGMIKYGMLNLKNHYQEVNDLNVFPVPDGDTGTNMRRTIETGYEVIEGKEKEPLFKVAQDLSKGMLLGARGNSGVILSQIFRGFSFGLEQKKNVSTAGLSRAFRYAVRQAYGAVVNPVEGTILTVIKESAAYATKNISSTIYSYICNLLKQAHISLQNTKEILPVLKEADVIDSGGAGLVYIFEGFKAYLEGSELNDKKIQYDEVYHEQPNVPTAVDLSAFNENSVLDFGYCTEFILQLQTSKVDVENFDEKIIIDYLKTQGDSIVCFKDGSVIKTHVHTKDPGAILSHVKMWGEFLTLKIENMSLQHNQIIVGKKNSAKKKIHKKYASVVVCQGEGLTKAFLDLGVDGIVDGKQTMNPSAKDFIKAFDELDAENIFVLPNNSNIILTAEQAAKIYSETNPEVKIIVIHSKTLAQGYIAASMFSFDAEDANSIIDDINMSIKDINSIEITTATRTTKISGVSVTKGHYIGIMDNKLLVDAEEKINCLTSTIDKVPSIDEKELLLVIYGKDVDEEQKIASKLAVREKHPNLEIGEISGDQDIYSYIIAVS